MFANNEDAVSTVKSEDVELAIATHPMAELLPPKRIPVVVKESDALRPYPTTTCDSVETTQR
ncbi:MAG: hypothetical protein GY807_16305 [Gammaproteobacteria bacterium]|nr:hypothetical protein [Gammaproteobacteria bacterium]